MIEIACVRRSRANVQTSGTTTSATEKKCLFKQRWAYRIRNIRTSSFGSGWISENKTNKWFSHFSPSYACIFQIKTAKKKLWTNKKGIMTHIRNRCRSFSNALASWWHIMNSVERDKYACNVFICVRALCAFQYTAIHKWWITNREFVMPSVAFPYKQITHIHTTHTLLVCIENAIWCTHNNNNARYCMQKISSHELFDTAQTAHNQSCIQSRNSGHAKASVLNICVYHAVESVRSWFWSITSETSNRWHQNNFGFVFDFLFSLQFWINLRFLRRSREFWRWCFDRRQNKTGAR